MQKMSRLKNFYPSVCNSKISCIFVPENAALHEIFSYRIALSL